mmetsp:Transcript_120649/g.341131  ORF Transcript_120649/g.341131 Transcript_120649/m.341131 type:complete len:289 (+) Transcript_120649:154-1020(+)
MRPLGKTHVVGALDFVMPLLRGMATIVVAGIGTMLFTTVGSLSYPVGGVGAIFGAIIGGVLFLLIGCCTTGFWKDFLPQNNEVVNLTSLLPHAVAVQLGGHGNFNLIVTVHEARNVAVQGRMPWRKPFLYVEVECGGNPIKRTCVRNDCKFNEQFKLQVAANDRSMYLRVKDQEIVGSRSVGYVCLDIQNHILVPNDGGEPFPRHKEFPIETAEGDNLRWGQEQAVLELSFDHMDDYGRMQEASQKRMGDPENQWNTNYGAVNFLSTLQFNPSVQIATDPPSGRRAAM